MTIIYSALNNENHEPNRLKHFHSFQFNKTCVVLYDLYQGRFACPPRPWAVCPTNKPYRYTTI